jgi:23S rRNA pseudouridine2605 synthase
MELVKEAGERVYPVGRLDYASEGLLLLTNDGDLANFLTRAASHVPKTYLVKVSGQPAEEDIQKLRRGIRLQGRPGQAGGPLGSRQQPGERNTSARWGPRRMEATRTAPAKIRMVREADNPWYEVTLIEGKNRQIRRMFEEIGHHVEKIKRVGYGPLKLDVEPGQYRELNPREVQLLRRGQSARPSAAEERDRSKRRRRPFR